MNLVQSSQYLTSKHEIDKTIILVGKILKILVSIVGIDQYLLHFENAIFKGKQTTLKVVR